MIPPSPQSVMRGAFPKLLELQLNGTLIDWPEMQWITAYMPQLSSVELGYNALSQLAEAVEPTPPSSAPLENVNLDGNSLTNWLNILPHLQTYPSYVGIQPCQFHSCHPPSSLARAVLSRNGLAVIPKLPDGTRQLPQLKHLSLTRNALDDWSSIDNLAVWCPNLEGLALIENPIVTGM